MKYLAATLVLICAIAQVLLLMAVTQRITGLKKGSPLPYVIIKVAVYGVVIALVMTVFRPYVIGAGISYAVGFTVTLGCVLFGGKKPEKGEDDDGDNN